MVTPLGCLAAYQVLQLDQVVDFLVQHPRDQLGAESAAQGLSHLVVRHPRRRLRSRAPRSRYTVSRWPNNASWDFVAVGRGHDADYWTKFLEALERIDPKMAVNLEHEDQELHQLEGLRYAADTLLRAAGRQTVA